MLKNMEVDLSRKKEAITALIRHKAIKDDLHHNIKEVITEVIEYFTKTVDENIEHIQKGLTYNSPFVVNKT